MLLILFSVACSPDADGSSSTDSAGNNNSNGGADTADTGSGTDTGDDTSNVDTDTDTNGDTAINDPDTGSDDADITGVFSGSPFTMNFADAPNPDIRCQESGDYYFQLQDASGTWQLTVNVAQPVEGTTVSYPSLGTNTFALGVVNTWALDTTYHGTVSSAHVTVDALKPSIRVTGTFEVSWVADGNGNPAANASGTFDVGCRD